MDQISRQLLYLLSVSMETDMDTVVDIVEADWDRLFYLSGIHNIIPMIYRSISKKQLVPLIEPKLILVWKKLATWYSVDQFLKTSEFLTIYAKLKQAGVNALVIKGIVLRTLYPNCDERCSGDEDIYIRREDYSRTASILTSSGFTLSNYSKQGAAPRQENVYVNAKSDLILEVHIDLFDPEIGIFKAMNDHFVSVFERSIEISIEGIPIRTLSYSDHLLFQILHCAKHFIGIGFGIRQVCDLVLFCNTHGKEIDYLWVWQQVTQLGYDTFLLNLFAIGREYLGLLAQAVWYPPSAIMADIHPDALLEDIMRAGAFGKSNKDRARTSSMTLQAVIADRNNRHKGYDKKQLLRISFPEQEIMGDKYSYCRNKPYLLPIAWLHRMATYAALVKNPVQMLYQVSRSFTIGRKRIELLKEYKIIGQHN